MSASLLPLPLSLNLAQHTRWTETQENALQTYPLADEGGVDEPNQIGYNIVRVYLQFLWLPESIMPLSLFVPAVTSASPPPSPTSPHPLHALLEPLLMAPRTASSKYYGDLPHILADGGGAGEIEESIMWFALSFEKSYLGKGDTEENEPWRDEKWRKGWLERMERREVQIQILLHFVKLSLLGPKPPNEGSPVADKMTHRSYLPRGHHFRRQTKPASLSIRDTLEVFMDKMSMWQLMQGLEKQDDASVRTKNDEEFFEKKDYDRDWIQTFVEDVIEKQFRPYLPDLCDLFHDKVFPIAPISNTNNDANMEAEPQSSTRSDSPGDSESVSHSASMVSSLKRKKDTLGDTIRLSRSRSLSVSLQQERESQRHATNQQKSKKRMLNKEVSMSRVFRAKSKGPTLGPDSMAPVFGTGAGLGENEKVTLHAKGKGKAVDEGEVTLVEATPVKNRIRTLSSASEMRLGGLKSKLASGREDGSADTEMDIDDWESELPKSRDIIMGTGDTDGDMVLVTETPRKAKPTKPTTKATTRG